MRLKSGQRNPPKMTNVSANAPRTSHTPVGMRKPDQPGEQTAAGNAPTVDGIGHAAVQHDRPKRFEKDNPHRNVKRNFPPARRLVVGTKTDPSINEEEDRQRHGHGKRVVEMTVKQGRVVVQARLDDETVDGVDDKRNEKQRVKPIAEPALPFNWHT